MLVITLTKLDLVFLTFVSLIFVVGIAMMFLPGKKFYTTPSEGKFELNWTTRQLLALVSKKASNRWYESRVHVRKGFWLSLLCALKVLHLVRVDFMHNSEDYGRSKTLVVPGWVRFNDIMLNHEWYVEKAREKLSLNNDKGRKYYYYYKTLVAGKNVVKDYMDNYE